MAMKMIHTTDAMTLILADYQGTLIAHQRLDIDGVQSALVEIDGAAYLLIRGSDELTDWLRNIRFRPEHSFQQGVSCWWHSGFLTYSRIVYDWAKDKDVAGVFGHSLGAACVQIVAPSLGVPGLAFASPRPLFAPFSTSARPVNAAMVTNYLRDDDWICDLPPQLLGFKHVGKTLVHRPEIRHDGEDHRIQHYLDVADQFT